MDRKNKKLKGGRWGVSKRAWWERLRRFKFEYAVNVVCENKKLIDFDESMQA